MSKGQYDLNSRRRLYRDVFEPMFLHFGLPIIAILGAILILVLLFGMLWVISLFR